MDVGCGMAMSTILYGYMDVMVNVLKAWPKDQFCPDLANFC